MREAASDDRLGAGEKRTEQSKEREKDEPQKLGEPPEVEGLPEADVAPEPEPASAASSKGKGKKRKRNVSKWVGLVWKQHGHKFDVWSSPPPKHS